MIRLPRAEMVHRHSMRVGVELRNRGYFPGVLGGWDITLMRCLFLHKALQCAKCFCDSLMRA